MNNAQSLQNGENNNKNENSIDINEYYNNIQYYKIKNADIKKDINNLKREFENLINHTSNNIKAKKEKKIIINKESNDNKQNNNINNKNSYENMILTLKQKSYATLENFCKKQLELGFRKTIGKRDVY